LNAFLIEIVSVSISSIEFALLLFPHGFFVEGSMLMVNERW
jgi:hypothetical protein